MSDPAIILRVGRIAVAMTVLLILVVVAWVLASGMSAGRLLFAAIAVAPLAACLPKLSAGHRRVCAMMTLLLVPYLMFALTEVIANPAARLWAGAALFTAFASFVCLIAFLRVSRAPPSPPARTEP